MVMVTSVPFDGEIRLVSRAIHVNSFHATSTSALGMSAVEHAASPRATECANGSCLWI